jgi:hypothetical protein
VGDENLNPLDELKRLDQQVGLVASLEGLKPIYYRLDEIAKQYANDFEVQLVVGDIKQHLVNRGTRLKEQETNLSTTSTVGTPPLPPPIMTAPPTKTISQPPPPLPTPPPMAAPPAPPPYSPPSFSTKPPFPTPPPMPSMTPPAPPPPIPSVPPPSGQFSPPPSLPTSAFPSTGPQAVPPQPPVPPVGPPPVSGQMPVQKPPAPQKPVAWKKALLFGAILGLLVAAAGIGFLVLRARKRNQQPPPVAAVEVQLATTPAGAAIKVNGEDKCTAPCSVSLAPGDYQITASLPGYEPGANGLNVPAAGGPPIAVTLTLEASPQSMHILAEGVDGGQVTVDDQPSGVVEDGKFVLDKLASGPHTVKIAAKGAEASFSFETAEAKIPSITGTTAKNLLAVVVASFGSNARVATSAGPLKLTLNGQPQGDSSPGGVDLQGFQPGLAELVVGDGPTQKTLQETFAPNPTLTVFLRSDKPAPPAPGDLGTLLVVTGEDDVRVFVNNKEQKPHTSHGQLRIPTLPGKVSVRVYKDGFNTPATQNADVQKGANVKVEFQLTKIDTGATPKPAPPPAPAPVTTNPNGTVHVTRAPGGATITYKRDNEAQPHQLSGNQIDLPPGSYVFTSKAPGFTDRTETVKVAAGTQAAVDLTLAAAHAAPSGPRSGGMADWEDPSGWTRDGENWVHKGGNFVPYKLPAKGTFEFTVQLLKGGGFLRGAHIRWYVDYVDPKNYGLFEIDKKNFWAKSVTNGKSKDREKTQHGLENQKTFAIRIEISPDHVVHRLKTGDTWLTLDSWTEPGRIFSDGKFGFYIPGSDEIAISDFKFTPK